MSGHNNDVENSALSAYLSNIPPDVFAVIQEECNSLYGSGDLCEDDDLSMDFVDPWDSQATDRIEPKYRLGSHFDLIPQGEKRRRRIRTFFDPGSRKQSATRWKDHATDTSGTLGDEEGRCTDNNEKDEKHCG